MALALAAGGRYVIDPGALVREMRPSTLAAWTAMYAIDPWDDNRADLRAAQIAAAVYGAAGCKKESGDAFIAADFMPYHEVQQGDVEVERKSAQALHSFLMVRSKKKG